MGSGQSTNSDTPYIHSEDEHLSIFGLGKERRISGDLIDPQPFYKELGNPSSIIHSERRPVQHLLRQQDYTNDQAARAFPISDLCLAVAPNANVHSAGYPMSSQPPALHGLNTNANHPYFPWRGSAIDDRSSTSANNSSYANQPTSNPLGTQHGYHQTSNAHSCELYDGTRQLANVPASRLCDSAPQNFNTSIEHTNSANLVSHIEKNGGGVGSASHFTTLSTWPSLNNATIPNAQKQNVEIGGGNTSRSYGVPHNRAMNVPNTGMLRSSAPSSATSNQQLRPSNAFVIYSQQLALLENPDSPLWASRLRHSLIDKRLKKQFCEVDKLIGDSRKKFRKLRVIFDEKMRQSDEWYKREQKCEEQIKRLAQENDELLDLLLDINNSAQIPADKRFDLSPGPLLPALPPLVSDEALREAAELNTPAGQAMYKDIRAMVEEKAAAAAASLDGAKPPKSLCHLLATVPHMSLLHPNFTPEAFESIKVPEGCTHPLTYLTPDQMDDYLFDVDASLGNASAPPVPTPQSQPTQENRDLALRNPNSVYNWLRKNEPKVFLQDNEGSEKSSGKPGALRGAGKRASIPAPSRPDALEFVEEDGIGYDGSLTGASANKGKRKRDDDDGGTYHPKSGKLDDTGAKVRVKRAYNRKKPKIENGEEKEKEKDKETPSKPEKKKTSRKPKEKLSSPPPGAHPFGPM